jgi:hypothetical protein
MKLVRKPVVVLGEAASPDRGEAAADGKNLVLILAASVRFPN